VAGTRVSREQAARLANAQPVVIAGIAIPFGRLVWWLAGITAGVTLVHTLFDWLIRVALALFAGGE
jgi:hypothetical protein